MRILCVIMFVTTILFSDVFSRAMSISENSILMVDHSSESESEKELELEVKLKKDAKLRHYFDYQLSNIDQENQQSLLEVLAQKLTTSYLEIHSPPPERA